MFVLDLKFGNNWRHSCLYHSNRSGFSVKNDLAMSCFTSTLLLLSQYPTRSSSTSTVFISSGRFGIPVDAVMKCFMECSTAGQTKELINNNNHKYDVQWKFEYDIKCVCLLQRSNMKKF